MLLTYTRTVILYLILIAVVRLMGKRQIGQMEPAEFVVTMLVANLAAIPMQDGAIPIYTGIVPIVTVLGAELVLSGLSLRWIPLRRLLCGKPVILIENGNILQKNLRKTRVTLDELSGHLREEGVLEIETVQYAILETNGALTVFPYPRFQPAPAKDAGITVEEQQIPYTVISDGRVLRKNLDLLGRDEIWLADVLSAKGFRAEDVMLMTCTPGGKTTVFRPDGTA